MAVCQTLALGQEMLPVIATTWGLLEIWASQEQSWPAALYSSCTYEQHLKLSSRLFARNMQSHPGLHARRICMCATQLSRVLQDAVPSGIQCLYGGARVAVVTLGPGC